MVCLDDNDGKSMQPQIELCAFQRRLHLKKK
jgi:hypothetical protein